MNTTLVIPGLHGSGPAHWQTWFESTVADCRRVEQPDWGLPSLPHWAACVGDHLRAAARPVWIVAHSFGCLAAVAAAQREPGHVLGALLVAPADPRRFGVSAETIGKSLPFPSLVIASENDPWLGLDSAAALAAGWRSGWVNIGRAGHINVDSGFGPWPEGVGFFSNLRRGARPSPGSGTAARLRLSNNDGDSHAALV